MKKARAKLVSPLDQLRNSALRVLSGPLARLSPRVKFGIGFAVLVVITTLLLANTFSRSNDDYYVEGDTALRSIVAPADFTTEDRDETERRRARAREETLPIFTLDQNAAAERAAQSFTVAWTALKAGAATGARPAALIWPSQIEAGDPAFVAATIAERKFSQSDFESLRSILRDRASGYIYADHEARYFKSAIIIVDLQNPGEKRTLVQPLSMMRSQSDARAKVQADVAKLVNWTNPQRSAILPALLTLVTPTVLYNASATATAYESAAAAATPAIVSLRRSQAVVREGDKITPQIMFQLSAIREYERTKRPWHHLFGLLFLVSALYWVAWKFVEHRSESVSLRLSPRRSYALVGSAVIMQTLYMRMGFTMADMIASQSMKAPLNDPTIWCLAIPVAAAALLVALLVDTQLGFLTGIFTALFAGMLAPSGMLMAFYAVVSASVAIYGIGRYRDRQSVTIAGILVGLVNAVMAVALFAYMQQPLTLRTILLGLLFGLIGGLLTAVFTAGGLPINESVFGILTDVKLLELSNADLPVLGQLALRAPGTNQHSHAVGQLAEEACRAVGANPLLARIGALYHDIGKLGAPEYFVENQHGCNPHDKLKPSNSARIITSHVNYGLKLAKEIGLPQLIADFIPQHHGTRTLHFFLRKAQALAADNEKIDEAEFRYPGPKPKFKEAAIMMIADSCEAAARSLAAPTPENIRVIVNKIVDAIVSDGQLDDCELNLRELTVIREAMVNSLTAIYHARIDYPGFNPPSLPLHMRPLPAAELDTEERGLATDGFRPTLNVRSDIDAYLGDTAIHGEDSVAEKIRKV